MKKIKVNDFQEIRVKRIPQINKVEIKVTYYTLIYDKNGKANKEVKNESGVHIPLESVSKLIHNILSECE